MNNKVHILFASRLVHEKGSDILLDVIEATFLDPILTGKIIWHIAAELDNDSKLIELQKKYSSDIVFHGKVPHIELASIYRSVDFLFMPSRFLETFGLTALESLASGVRVIGIRKGGLIDFIPDSLSIDESQPVESSLRILRQCLSGSQIEKISVKNFRKESWVQTIESIFKKGSNIFIVHDYYDPIGGAEIYVDFLIAQLPQYGYFVSRSGYNGKTTPWNRRFMFVVSIFSFTRGWKLYKMLKSTKPQAIWIHSILRYYGIWGMLAVNFYATKSHCQVFLSHHDVGLLAPFPQKIYKEAQIPKSYGLGDFLFGLSFLEKIIALFKWGYVMCLSAYIPRSTTHIIFSKFLEKHIKNHFPGDNCLIVPHTFDETLFYPKD